jgi:acetyl-CoA carboxylase alpha subunit
MTAAEILQTGAIEAVVPEPPGGAHHDWAEAARLLEAAVLQEYAQLKPLGAEELVRTRIERFGRIGVYSA